MKIVNILGGLGNQMFQYALAVALKAKHPDEKILIDSSGFRGYPLHNGYELTRIFDIQIQEATIMEQSKLFYPLRNYRMWQIGRRILPRRKSVIYDAANMAFVPGIVNYQDAAYYLGYWQTEKYFKDIRPKILEAFRFPALMDGSRNAAFAVKMSKMACVVSVHVRRGDYTKIANTQGICTLDYYKEALRQLLSNVTPDMFVVFSDDTEWSRENLNDYFANTPVTYVDWNKGSDSFRDMQLMSLCHHNIIANSSFSWWGAWLNQNPDKIVIVPSRWMNDGGWPDMIPDNWYKIK